MATPTPHLSQYSGLPAWCDPARLAFSMRLDEATPSNNTVKEMHFHAYKKLREKFSLMVRAALAGRLPSTAVKTAGVFVVRHCAGKGLDWDNAYGGLKPLLDCLVSPSTRNPNGLGLIQDDNPLAMPEPPYVRQLTTKKGAGYTEVFVFDVSG